MYQPKTGARCGCKRGVQRDNCPACEGTGMVVDFAAIHARNVRACDSCGQTYPLARGTSAVCGACWQRQHPCGI